MTFLAGPIEVSKNIYWVGIHNKDRELNCNSYLIVDGDEGVLIDPGSVLEFDYIYENVKKILPIENITYFVLTHQDPDICSSIPLFENKGFKGKLATHWRSALLIKYYGVKSSFYHVDEHGYSLTLNSGKIIDFISTPYLHFPGAIAAYDRDEKVLFSSDIFGAISENWTLFAEDAYFGGMKTFHEHYMPNKEILSTVMSKFRLLDINMIAPQHGSIIKENVSEAIDMLANLECGSFVAPLKKNLMDGNGYLGLSQNILDRFTAVFKKELVIETFKDSEIILNEDGSRIVDFNMSGAELWDYIFDTIYKVNGIKWLTIIEPSVRKIVNTYDIEFPAIFSTTLSEHEKLITELEIQNTQLRIEKEAIENELTIAQNQLILCPITNLYNEKFFDEFIIRELDKEDLDSTFIMYINIDDMMRYNYSYGNTVGDEILKVVAGIITENSGNAHLSFKRNAPGFICFMRNETWSSAKKQAELLRQAIKNSEAMIETITVSIGLMCVDEIDVKSMNTSESVRIIKSSLTSRVDFSKRQGGDFITAHDIEGQNASLGKVVIIDNDVASNEILKTSLAQHLVDVYIAEDGVEGYELIEQIEPDVIVCERLVERMDGFILKEKLKANFNLDRIPFLLISHQKNDKLIERSIALGIKHYYKKPYYLSEIVGIIKSIVRGE